MKGRRPRALEQAWLNQCAQIPCIVCQIFFDAETPAEIHHLDGKTKPDSHMLTIPLCPRHHRQKDNRTPKDWVSRHGDGKAAFEKAYLSELELLNRTREKIEVLHGYSV